MISENAKPAHRRAPAPLPNPLPIAPRHSTKTNFRQWRIGRSRPNRTSSASLAAIPPLRRVLPPPSRSKRRTKRARAAVPAIPARPATRYALPPLAPETLAPETRQTAVADAGRCEVDRFQVKVC